jgi:hypothetical protein
MWVRPSAPAGCSPRGLGEVSYPFKGFKSSDWAHLDRRGVAPSSCCCDALRPDAWEGGEVPSFLCSWGVGRLAPSQLPHTTL